MGLPVRLIGNQLTSLHLEDYSTVCSLRIMLTSRRTNGGDLWKRPSETGIRIICRVTAQI